MHARRVRLRADELSHVPLALRLVVGQQKVPELVAETAERERVRCTEVMFEQPISAASAAAGRVASPSQEKSVALGQNK